LKEHIRYHVLVSGLSWSSATVVTDYMVPLLQKELQFNPFGVCADLIPVPSEKSHIAAKFSQQAINEVEEERFVHK
jgi:hypothetical protein